MSQTPATSQATGTSPARQGLVLVALILVAAAANLPLAVANVALPSIGQAFPKGDQEKKLLADYARLDSSSAGAES